MAPYNVAFGKRTPHGTNNCSTANPSAYGTSPKTGEEYAVGLPTEGREVLRATIYSLKSSVVVAKKKPPNVV